MSEVLSTPQPAVDLGALKSKQHLAWSSGDYAVVGTTLQIVGEMLCEAIREATKRFNAANPRVFGSVLHGTDRDGSDLDLLVDLLPGTTLFDLGGLQVELEDLLGVAVEVLTPGDLPVKFRQQVLDQARPV